MKNRRTIVLAFLLCACFIVGAGYAALTDTLSINGTANISGDAAEQEFDEDIYFTAAVGDEYCTAALGSGEKPDTATISILNTMGVTGDEAVATFTIQNDAKSAVTLTVAADNTNAKFRLTADQATYNIPAGESIQVKVTVTLLVTVTDATPIEDEAFSIGFTATSAG